MCLREAHMKGVDKCHPLPFLQYSQLTESCIQLALGFGSISNIRSPILPRPKENTHSQTLMQSLWK